MATSEIGGRSFDAMTGRPVAPAPRIQTIDHAGEDYAATRDLGDKAPAVEIRTGKIVANVAAADTEIDACLALIGTSVTVSDRYGADHSGCKVIDFRPWLEAIVHEGSNKIMVHGRWTVRQGG